MQIPDDFGHPYQPYQIQVNLMQFVYRSVEARQVAIVESPTGTGKSLSLICSSLSWILDNEQRVIKTHEDDLRQKLLVELENEPAWVVDREVNRQINELKKATEELDDRIKNIKQKEADARATSHARKRQKLSHPLPQRDQNGDSDSDFAPEDIGDDLDVDEDGIAPDVKRLLKRYHGNGGVEEEDRIDVTKVVFASRTHSQLSQFMHEIKKTRFKNMRTIALSGRSHLCINDQIKAASTSNEDLNERCLDLQKKGKDRCPYLPPADEVERLNDFRDHALSEVYAIEDLEDLGRQRKTCPYYGARKAIPEAQLVAVPYQLLLQENSRSALGLSIKDNVVIIDEAHALIDTILNSRTASIDTSVTAIVLQCLQAYKARFQAVLKGINLLYLAQLIALLEHFHVFATKWLEKKEGHQMLTTTDLAVVLELDALPVRKLDAWIREANMARKISGYAANLAENKQKKDGVKIRAATTSTMYRIQSFFLCLAEPDKDGRVLLTRTTSQGQTILQAKYLLLNPEESFKDIVEDARSVILAGGTMAPMRDFEEQLFSFLPKTQLGSLSCGHVIPATNLLARSLSVGPSGAEMLFNFGRRRSTELIDELGQSLFGMANVVDGGVIVFFPSYSFLDEVLARWKATGLLSRFEKKRQIFSEAKEASQTSPILESYSAALKNGQAILFAVVGAKLSEGINFADRMCRLCVICGIPFPSTQSVELQERMNYVRELGKRNGQLASIDQGKMLYTTLAFRAVNQAAGRCIRHANDWSAIVLLDARYGRPSSKQMLSKWISADLAPAASFGSLIKDLASFRQSRQ